MAKRDMVPFGEQLPEDMSFQELLDAGVVHISDIDDVVVVEQEQLVDVPFVLFDWEIKASDTYGGSYALCRVKTAEGTRVFADGGVGIQEQLDRYKGKLSVNDPHRIFCPHGLRKSSYVKKMEDGSSIPATTYYLDNKS